MCVSRVLRCRSIESIESRTRIFSVHLAVIGFNQNRESPGLVVLLARERKERSYIDYRPTKSKL